MNTALHLSSSDWLALLTQFLSLSLLAVGGAITTVPDMHRTLVNEHQWLTDSQFNSSIYRDFPHSQQLFSGFGFLP